MSAGTIALPPTAVASFHIIDPPSPIHKSPIIYLPSPPSSSSVMWRNLAKQAISRTPTTSYSLSPPFNRPYCFLRYYHTSNLRGKCKFRPIELSYCKKKRFFDAGPQRNSDFLFKEDAFRIPGWTGLANPMNFHGISHTGFVSLADVEAVSSPDVEDKEDLLEEISALLVEMRRCEEEKKKKMMKETEGSRRRKRVAGMGPKKYWAMRRRQVQVETEVWEKATKEYKELLVDMCEHKLAPNLPYIKTLFLGWFEPFRDKIVEVQESIWKGKCRNSFAPYFDQLPADMMAVITMHKLVGLLLTGDEHGCARVVQAACVIGDAIEQETRIQKFLDKTKKKKKKPDQDNKDEEEGSSGALQEQQRLRKKVTDLLKKKKLQAVRHIVKDQDDAKPWSTDAKAKVGSHLIELLLQTAYIQVPGNLAEEGAPDVRPAFVHTFKTVPQANKNSTRRYGVVQCDAQVIEGLQKTARHMVIPYMPMLIPPIKWTGYDQGAHLILPSSVMRTHGSKQQREAVKRAPIGQIQPVYQALDTLGKTRWRVNKRVLSTVDAIWSNGGRLGDLVDRDDVPLPEKPITEDEAEIKKWKWKVRSVKKENRERHSQRCDIELKLAVAQKMRDEEGFFYPHNVDFRGRAYPMHPYLNHLGSDLCRGILEFAEGRPLGESGLRWLKIHLANLFANGVDKLPLEGRIAFTESHLDEIFDSAYEPLQGKQWWLKAEDPFQCLAVCVDLAEALRSPCPFSYISHIPVHQDGSCNGLQHYAALGRDELGAASVNLVAGDKPADVYSGIAARVLNIMKQDAEEDPDVYTEALYARQLIHQVDRKLVKQTVMTSVYGVTYIGARDQIKRRLKERDIFSDSSDLFYASCYAAKVTLTALVEMFQAARCIMSWLGDCAKIIASENQSVGWITPLGLPVVQPYRQRGRHLVRTSLQVLTLQRETEKVMMKRQRTAFPPNFVHSLDGSHMMMTALACRKAGLNFAGVHDSYWTHACDVDKMNQILREKFVELYEQPILENLLESFEKSFPTLSFPPLPERGNFNIREVLKSPYFFN